MSLVVNTNIGSLNAQRSLSSSGNELKTAMERLSSGKKINSAADDAAGFAIAERMTAQIRGLNMATKNANDGLSMLAVIENATNDVTDMLHRMRELAVQAANDTNSQEDRKFLQKEVTALIEEIDRVATQTQYNNQTILDGSYQNKSIQVGTETGQTIEFDVDAIGKGDLGDITIQAEYQGEALGVSRPASGWGNGYSKIELDSNTSFQAGDKLSIAGWGDFNVVEAGDANAEGAVKVSILDNQIEGAEGTILTGTFTVVEGNGTSTEVYVSNVYNTHGWQSGLDAAGIGDKIQAEKYYTPAGKWSIKFTGSAEVGNFDINTGAVANNPFFSIIDQNDPETTIATQSNAYVVVEDHQDMDAQQAFNNMQNGGGDYFAVSKIAGHHSAIEGIDLVDNATQALVTITSAIEQVAGDRAEYGALQNRLEYTVSNLMNVAEFTTAARSRIEDADFAAESARLAKAQVLQQTGTAMLAQANSSSQLVMSLIR